VTLTLYNTLTRKKAAFTPIDPRNVRMYVCGPTVYDFAHIGNARPVIVFDVLYRLLRHIYGESHVTYARNITDVDDKINARALRDFPQLPLNDAIARVTEKTANQFHADVKALGCLEPTVEPRATDNIAQMIAIIEQLLAKGHAYRAAGEVLFDVKSMPDYGALSNRNLDDQQAGARVEVEAHKKNPGDFVLWKLSSPEEPGWESPWGRGRPGWHIECSAMSARYLGQVFDIHGGGLDLIFPHHENEIAQSRCAHGTPVMANVWMHNGFLQVEGEKMSKSLGNFVTINELLETTKFGGRTWPGDCIRLQMLGSHYRQPIDWTLERALECDQTVASWVDAIGLADLPAITSMPTDDVVEALVDDLNTPAAVAIIHDRAKTSSKTRQASQELANNLAFMGIFRDYRREVLPIWKAAFPNAPAAFDSDQTITLDLGVMEMVRRVNLRVETLREVLSKASEFRKYGSKNQSAEALVKIDPGIVNAGIDARLVARKAKDFKESDRIRDELAKMGIALKDSKDPATGEIVTTWEVAR
jgi:cysteinyl-tRNA synthetase